MSGLSNVIVYVTAFILLVDKIRHERLAFDTPPYTLKNVCLLLRLQLEKSIILRNLWNVTPVQGKVCVYFNPLNVKAVYIFLTESVERIQRLSSVSYQGWYAGNALGGSRGVVHLMMDYS